MKRKHVIEQIKHTDENGKEFRMAQQLAKILKYSEYRYFLPAIERAKEACVNSSQNTTDHFEDILEMIKHYGALNPVIKNRWVLLLTNILHWKKENA